MLTLIKRGRCLILVLIKNNKEWAFRCGNEMLLKIISNAEIVQNFFMRELLNTLYYYGLPKRFF